MKPDWRKLWKDNKHLVFFIVMLVAFLGLSWLLSRKLEQIVQRY